MTLTTDYTTLKLTVNEDKVATVTLNRPDLHNAFNEVLIAELTKSFKDLGQDNEVRMVILTGSGKSFCAGADINWMKSMIGFSYKENIQDSQNLADMFKVINECPKPVIGRINGAAFGGGVGLTAVCDIAVAVESAKFSFSEVKLGIAPAVVSPYVLARIGPGNARKLFITGERFDANKAVEIGLIHQVTRVDELDESVNSMVKMLLSNSPNAVKEVKSLIANWSELDRERFRKFTVEMIAELRTSEEGKEGLQAFLDKRKPEGGK